MKDFNQIKEFLMLKITLVMMISAYLFVFANDLRIELDEQIELIAGQKREHAS